MPDSEFFWSVFSCIRTDYSVSLRVQSECGKIRTKKNAKYGQFSLVKCMIVSFRLRFKNWYLSLREKEPILKRDFCNTKVQFALAYTTKHCLKSVRIRSFSGPYFLAFWLNKKRFSVSLHIQSECGKIRIRNTPSTDNFHQWNVWLCHLDYVSRIDGFHWEKRSQYSDEISRIQKTWHKKPGRFYFNSTSKSYNAHSYLN